VPFEDHVRRRRKKQNPVAENRNTPLRKTATPTGTSVTENRNIRGHPTVAENRNISSSTTTSASLVPEKHTRKSLMQYVADVINEQLHELDR
jgi:hypothetical protein